MNLNDHRKILWRRIQKEDWYYENEKDVSSVKIPCKFSDIFRPFLYTLKSLINEHACLTILNFFSTLLALIRVCSLNYFQPFSYPAL